MEASIHRMDKQKVLLYSAGEYIQYSVIDHNGKEYFKKDMYVCMYAYIYIYIHYIYIYI